MFKRVLESLSKSLGGKSSKSAPAPAPSKQPAKGAPPAASSAPPAGKGQSILDKVAAAPAKAAPAAAKKPSSPEELCGITAKMTKDQIGAQLKLLYRRYNRGASSLDARVRQEADEMLDAIVAMREKTFGEL